MQINLSLIQRRDISIILFVLVLAQALFQFTSPIDLTNPSNLIIDVVLFTGYLYLARSVLRLPLAIITGIFLTISDSPSRLRNSLYPFPRADERTIGNYTVTIRKNFVGLVMFIIEFLLIPIVITGSFAKFIQRRAETKQIKHRLMGYEADEEFSLVDTVFGILDRISLVTIVAISTWPRFQGVVKPLGVLGLIFMLLIYIFRGSFSALVRDMFEQEDEQKEQESD